MILIVKSMSERNCHSCAKQVALWEVQFLQPTIFLCDDCLKILTQKLYNFSENQLKIIWAGSLEKYSKLQNDFSMWEEK